MPKGIDVPYIAAALDQLLACHPDRAVEGVRGNYGRSAARPLGGLGTSIGSLQIPRPTLDHTVRGLPDVSH
jgi:hypothetical protein